ncbi:diguanylate cyclase (GGDEF)-like protein [Paenibacillus phyllosphaerae]|uniref:Diguanylate cyclase (GGDEF)-like protein n=1 Tax=Paenibacillus phyllosphaerae TaxID=274593 RepID=A0A7W5FPK7_9BACL|nr:EAL domain-containing protein [Paenibacillus phyllosphaerae]MBB3112332.1 diguanylate cyclase (GGDEF)-like protein [Paenibacillus phyllosphaerae]
MKKAIHLVMAAVLFASLLTLGEWAIRKYERSLLDAVDSETQIQLASWSMTLQAVADRNFGLMASLDAYVSSFDQGQTKDEFALLTNAFLRTLYHSTGSIAYNFIIAPDGIVAYVYPEEGNDSILGWNFLQDPRPSVKKQIALDIADPKMHVYGPMKLLQGNMAILARKSIYQERHFWGLVSVAIDLDTLLAQTRISDKGAAGSEIAIRAGEEPAFYGDNAIFTGKHFAHKVHFPQTTWEMGAVPSKASLKEVYTQTNIVRAMSFLALLLLALIYMGIRRQRDTLRLLVDRRTKELRDSNDELAAINDNLAAGEQELREQYALLDQYAGALRDSEIQLSHMAYHDSLTDISNRASFQNGVERLLSGKPEGFAAAVLFFDLDRFKMINDNYGHQQGDQMLVEVAHRIKRLHIDMQEFARFGGDEFALLLAGSIDECGLPRIRSAAERILDAFVEPFDVEGKAIYMSPSIGISCYPEDGINQGTLLMKADIAMYQAKRDGGGSYRFFEPYMETESMQKLEMGNHLREAMLRGELEVYYQPQVDCTQGRIFGIEALLRWNHTKRGFISPAQFIPLAEELNLIVPIGEWVLREACQYTKKLQQEYGIPLQISVNLSVKQLMEKDIVDKVHAVLEETGLSPSDLELEITENMAMKDEQLETLGKLRELGIAISIDDFGTHYSSLSYLKRFPVTKIKLDQFFVRGIQTDERDRAMIRAIILMAKSFQLQMVAEGVETPEQAQFLNESGCELIQGFYFFKPMPADDVRRVLLESQADKIKRSQ